METLEAQQQQQTGVPHMENPFESAGGEQQQKSDVKNKNQSKTNKRDTFNTKQQQQQNITGGGSRGVEEKDEEEEKQQQHTAMDNEDDDEQVEGEGELNYMSISDAIGNTFVEPGQDASAESSFDSEHKEDDKQTDASSASAAAAEEEKGRRESAQRIKRQLAAADERQAGIQVDNTRQILNEDAVQDALIQAAEDAMRYAYEEASRKKQPSTTGSTNSLPNSFEQHQLAEVLVRQKQGLLRLEELEHKLDEMGSQMDKLSSMIQQQQNPSSAMTSSSAGGAATERSTATNSMSESASMPTVPVMDTTSNKSGPPSIRTARRLMDDATTTSEQQQGETTSLNNKQQDYPLSVTLPRRIMFKALQLIDLVKSQSTQFMQQLSGKLLARLGKESWNDVRLTMRSTLREFGTRIIVQLRRIRTLISEGRLDPNAQAPGWRQIYEGFEDRVLATAIISALATLFLLYRHRQRQNLMLSARETGALAPSSLLAIHVQKAAGPVQQKTSGAAPVPFLVT